MLYTSLWAEVQVALKSLLNGFPWKF